MVRAAQQLNDLPCRALRLAALHYAVMSIVCVQRHRQQARNIRLIASDDSPTLCDTLNAVHNKLSIAHFTVV